MAATRRGWVQPIFPLTARPSSAMYCVICVVLPLPVSPITINIWLSMIAWRHAITQYHNLWSRDQNTWTNSARSLYMGRACLCSSSDNLVFLPYDTLLPPNACFFHSGTSGWRPRPPLKSAAKKRFSSKVNLENFTFHYHSSYHIHNTLYNYWVSFSIFRKHIFSFNTIT